jgi:outer membrane PBP1 activator LpoA protein
MQGTNETTKGRWQRYCELKAQAMEQEAAMFETLAAAAAEDPHKSEEERAADIAHCREMAASYRNFHATFWRKQVAA